jgi:hypothetical protein
MVWRPDHQGRNQEPDENSRDILRRVERETSGPFGGTFERALSHFSARDADPSDRIEVWGRRVGRLLSLVGVVVLLWLLFRQLGG